MSFIIYAITANGIPFYIGRTCDLKRRKSEHMIEQHNPYKANKIRKCKRLGIDLEFIKLHETTCFQESIDLEIFEIKEHKERGIKLTNLTEGGEGQYGVTRTFTEEWKNNLKKAKRRLFATGYTTSNKGKTLEEIMGVEKATAQKIRIGEKISEGRRNGTMTTTLGRKLDDMVGVERSAELKKEFSDRAKRTFTGRTQSETHKKCRIDNQKLTKANWTEEQRNKVREINKLNGSKSKKKYNFEICIKNQPTVFKHYGSWKSLSIALNNERLVKVDAGSLSKIYRGIYKYTNIPLLLSR